MDIVHELCFKLIVALYFDAYSSKFDEDLSALLTNFDESNLLSLIRKNTWHITMVKNNTIPSIDAIQLRSKRMAYVLKKLNIQTHHLLEDISNYGWEYGSDMKTVKPKWDSEESIEKIDLIRKAVIKKCGCGTTRCIRGNCVCLRSGERCTSLCKCTDCLNIEIYAEDEEEYEDEEVNDTEDTGNDDDDLAEDPFGRNIFDDCFSL